MTGLHRSVEAGAHQGICCLNETPKFFILVNQLEPAQLIQFADIALSQIYLYLCVCRLIWAYYKSFLLY